MRHQAYTDYCKALEALTDAQLVERTATEFEAVCRGETDGDPKAACRAEAIRRGKDRLYADGVTMANRRMHEAEAMNKENRS